MSTVDTVTDPFEDEFATPAPAPEQPLRRGRYYLPRRDGTEKPRGWMRATNLVSAYSDQYALRIWEHLEVLRALVRKPELLDPFTIKALDAFKMGPFGNRKEFVEDWLTQAKAVSGGDVGSKFGTQRHEAVEAHHTGLIPPSRHDAGTRRHLALYASALERNQLQALPGMQERIVLVEALEVCGRLDNVLYDHGPDNFGIMYIGDLKTQRKFHTWLEVSAQFAVYANADAMWDAAVGQWVDMPPVSRDVALALWMPRETEDGEPRVDVWEVDIRRGWETAQQAFRVVQDRKDGKARARLRPAPAATETERWAARFAAVDTHTEGTALVIQAKAAGVWGPALAESAKLAAERLLTVTQI